MKNKIMKNKKVSPVWIYSQYELTHLSPSKKKKLVAIVKSDIRGFSWLTQAKSAEELKKKEEPLEWKGWAGHPG
jgi:hypothetical protein